MRKMGIFLVLLAYLGIGCAVTVKDVNRWEEERNVERLIVALKGGHWPVRQATAYALGEIGDKRAVEPLVAVLEKYYLDLNGRFNECGYLRAATAEALGKIGDKRSVSPLIAKLNYGERMSLCKGEGKRVRYAATEALVKIGAPAVEPLIECLGISKTATEGGLIYALRDENSLVRLAAAIETLGRIADVRAVAPLIAKLREHKDSDVRRAAAKALGEIGDKRAVEPLLDALRDKDWSVRVATAKALREGNIDWQPKDNIKKAWLLVPYKKWDELSNLGAPAVEPLISVLKCYIPMRQQVFIRQRKVAYKGISRLSIVESKDDEAVQLAVPHKAAAETLIKIGVPAVKPLISALRDEDSGVRAAAAEALGQIGGKQTINPLIAALGDEKSLVRKAATKALVEIGAPAVEPLNVVLREWHSDARSGAAKVLGEIGDKRSVDLLVDALKKDKDLDVQAVAAKALGNIGDKRAVEPLLDALRDKDWSFFSRNKVRKAALKALGQIGDKRAVEPLITVLRKDEDQDVREVAANALKKLGYQP